MLKEERHGTRTYSGLAMREAVGLSIFFFLFFAGIAFPFSFLPIYVTKRGCDLGELAVLMALFALVGGTAQIYLGHISDSLGSRKLIGSLSCISLGLSYVFYTSAHGFWQFLPLYLWTGLSFLGGFTIPQTIIADWASVSSSTARAFSMTRIWGTFGYIIALFAVVFRPDVANGRSLLYWAAAFYITAGIALLTVREAAVHQSKHSMFKGAKQVILSQRAYMFLLCYTLFRVCESGMWPYLSIFIKELGGDTRAVSIAFCASAIGEIPFVMFVGRLSDRIGRKLPLVVAFAVWPIRLFLYSLIHEPSTAYYIQLLHGFTYGITLVCGVSYMSDIAPKELRGTAQGLLSLANAAAMFGGPLVTGFVGNAIGLRPTFQVLAAISVLALVILILFVSEPQRERDQSSTSAIAIPDSPATE